MLAPSVMAAVIALCYSINLGREESLTAGRNLTYGCHSLMSSSESSTVTNSKGNPRDETLESPTSEKPKFW